METFRGDEGPSLGDVGKGGVSKLAGNAADAGRLGSPSSVANGATAKAAVCDACAIEAAGASSVGEGHLGSDPGRTVDMVQVHELGYPWR